MNNRVRTASSAWQAAIASITARITSLVIAWPPRLEAAAKCPATSRPAAGRISRPNRARPSLLRDPNPNGGGQVQLTPSGKIIERFTRYDNDQILYEFEVVDPALYTQNWKGEIALNRTKGEMYEYACHEGNYGLHGILEGGRNNDRMGKSNARSNDRGDEG